jgi:hypothetical protein
VGAVVLLGGEQEHAEFRPVESSRVRGVHLRAPHVLRRVRGDATVDVSEPVEAAHGREATVNGRRSESAIFHPAAIELDVRTRRVEH